MSEDNLALTCPFANLHAMKSLSSPGTYSPLALIQKAMMLPSPKSMVPKEVGRDSDTRGLPGSAK